MMDKSPTPYGAPVERGTLLRAEGAGWIVASIDRPGIVSPAIAPILAPAQYAQGQKVLFFLFSDGTGGILAPL